jgi:hypothetical protein
VEWELSVLGAYRLAENAIMAFRFFCVQVPMNERGFAPD